MRNGRIQLINNLYGSMLKEVATFENHNTVNKKSSEVTPYDYFENIERYHGFSKAINKIWVNHVKILLSCYQKLTSIIHNTKMAPYKKVEAAVSMYLLIILPYLLIFLTGALHAGHFIIFFDEVGSALIDVHPPLVEPS
ncbi:hypothetical protein RirG_023150 [Rhizophagus irregularis DAOM 197198w]|uniref:Uncharacterized protein n=1 Tax=Rhizophagus irregularis (strain DAOM 197198w) TaxID=1432141 RepID=A0A015K6W2_RHIIW|nr:hypothetical protein RirG_023150 [Rhizophagus irregularis DAOM 197198w]